MGQEDFKLERTVDQLFPNVEFFDLEMFKGRNDRIEGGADPTNVSFGVMRAHAVQPVNHMYPGFLETMDLNQQASGSMTT